jgi:hypothetical protein
MMELTLDRPNIGRSELATLGALSVNGVFECLTLEDTIRKIGTKGEGKVTGKTAIPRGKYRIIINESPKFKRPMMRLMNVPHFTGILIHGGNTVEDTSGCILVGDQIKGIGIVPGTSTPAIRRLFDKVKAALDEGENVWITISQESESQT